MSTNFLTASSQEARGILFSIFTVGVVGRLISVKTWEEGRAGVSVPEATVPSVPCGCWKGVGEALVGPGPRPGCW